LLVEFRIFETRQFLQDLEQDFSGQQDRVKRKLLSYVYPQLRQNPYVGKNIKKLRDYHPQTWRYRIGGWRFFYTIDDRQHLVFMISADARGSAY
jgi:mRNA interferase RelE/StbE